MYLGAQLFGVLANTNLSLAEVLKKLRDIGYTHVEPAWHWSRSVNGSRQYGPWRSLTATWK